MVQTKACDVTGVCDLLTGYSSSYCLHPNMLDMSYYIIICYILFSRDYQELTNRPTATARPVYEDL